MRLVNKGDRLVREGGLFEVVCADDEVFIVAPREGNSTDWEKLEGYSNDSRTFPLKGTGFEVAHEAHEDTFIATDACPHCGEII